ncbi:hypothetical protein ACVLD2_001131 [Paenibacillus sp. PvR052]|nr:hypothetical protein [Paenibacillus sp. PvP091]MBP1169649.1 hypothetical protein [Paenibacillus sp. PvR098]MBP2440677.1 hypothetical protein [Paenibacillus sp. PvP052]
MKLVTTYLFERAELEQSPTELLLFRALFIRYI